MCVCGMRSIGMYVCTSKRSIGVYVCVCAMSQQEVNWCVCVRACMRTCYGLRELVSNSQKFPICIACVTIASPFPRPLHHAMGLPSNGVL